MAAPIYRCPFKVDTTTDQGITCENINCAIYNASLEHCMARLFLEKATIGSIGKDYGGG